MYFLIPSDYSMRKSLFTEHLSLCPIKRHRQINIQREIKAERKETLYTQQIRISYIELSKQ